MKSIRQRTVPCLCGMAGALLTLLVPVIAVLPGKIGTASTESVYGSFLLSKEAGGYVPAAVIFFALGVCVTLLCLKIGNKRKAQSFNSTMTGRE